MYNCLKALENLYSINLKYNKIVGDTAHLTSATLTGHDLRKPCPYSTYLMQYVLMLRARAAKNLRLLRAFYLDLQDPGIRYSYPPMLQDGVSASFIVRWLVEIEKSRLCAEV
jgi:hypothetical protein